MKMDLSKLKWELRNELLIEFTLIFVVYMYSICFLTCCVREYMKYDCVKAVIHSKTYFGLEKDACVPTKPLNGVCMGVVFSYKKKEHTGYVQVDHDKFKIGDSVELCIEKKDPDMFSLDMKKDLLKLVYWLLLSILLALLSSIKLSLWSARPNLFNRLLLSNVVFGVIFMVLILTMKKQ
jgi:hypothetical protein